MHLISPSYRHARLLYILGLRLNTIRAVQGALHLCWADQRSITTSLPPAAGSAAEDLLALAGRAVFFCFAGLIKGAAAAAFLLGAMRGCDSKKIDWMVFSSSMLCALRIAQKP